MSSANAWLLDVGGTTRVAIGLRELVQITEVTNSFSVPMTPAWCRKVMFWQKRMLPVMDLSIRINHTGSKANLLAIVAYQTDEPASAGLAGILLAAPPQRITVNDAQACTLDESMAAWRELANASFTRDNAVIPVLNLSRLFGATETC